MRPVPLILDTDIGGDVDDALALALAAGDRRFDLRAVTIVGGEGDVRARVARALLEMCGRADVPVGIGREAPLDWRPNRYMPAGPGPMSDGVALAPPADLPAASDVIRRTLLAADEPVSVCCIGPVTNVAMALNDEPALIDKVDAVHVMGGCLGPYELDESQPGSPFHEFNFGCDPAAVALLFSLPVALRITPIDVTMSLELGTDERAEMAAAGALGAELGRHMERWLRIQRQERPDRPGRVATVRLHDPLAVAGVVEPAVAATEPLLVSVTGRPNQVTTAVSPHGRAVTAVRRADRQVLVRLLLDAVG